MSTITPAPLAIQHCCYQHHHTATTTTNQQQQWPHQITRQNYCYPLLPLPSVDCQYINRHNSHIKTNADRKITLLRHSVSVCYHHWVKRQINIYPGGCCHVKMTAFTIACKTAISISHFLIHCPHILTVTTADDPPKNITFNMLSILHSKEEIHTTYFERWENL